MTLPVNPESLSRRELEDLEEAFDADLLQVFGEEKKATMSSHLRHLLWELWLRSKQRTDAKHDEEEQALFEHRLQRSPQWHMVEKTVGGVDAQMDRKIQNYEEHIKDLTHDQIRSVLCAGENIQITSEGDRVVIKAETIRERVVPERDGNGQPVVAIIPRLPQESASQEERDRDRANQDALAERLEELDFFKPLGLINFPYTVSGDAWCPVFLNRNTGELAGFHHGGNRYRAKFHEAQLVTHDGGITWEFLHQGPLDSNYGDLNHVSFVVDGAVKASHEVMVHRSGGAPSRVEAVTFTGNYVPSTSVVIATFPTLEEEFGVQ